MIRLCLRRRQLAVGSLALLAGCQAKEQWHNIDISGEFPQLQFTMADADGGGIVGAESFLGRTVLLYFGYTDCPDVCPLTLGNIAKILDQLGPLASWVRVLFVTVDPNHDSLETLKAYTAQFAPQIVGLRGTPDQLAALARTYRIAYSVTSASPGHPYDVTHSAAVYAFDAKGAARLLIPSLASTKPDIAGTTADVQQLILGPPRIGVWDWLRQRV
jgi:protein SCO1/2